MLRLVLVGFTLAGLGYAQNTQSAQKFGSIASGGTVPHYAIGQGGLWSTEFQVFHLEEGIVPFTLNFFNSAGNPEEIELFDATDQPLGTTSVFTGILQPGGVAILRTKPDGPLQTGYAVLEAPGFLRLAVTAIITNYVDGEPQYRTAVPSLGRFQAHLRMPFTNRKGFFTGMAWKIESDQTVTMIARDAQGTELCRDTREVVAETHEAFILAHRLPCVADRDGLLEVVSSSFGVVAIGLSFDLLLRMWTQIPYEVCCFDVQ